MSIIGFIKGIFTKKQKLEYPKDFLIVDHIGPAKIIGDYGDRTKRIYRKKFNEYGEPETISMPYNEARIKTLVETHKIPVLDKTRRKVEYAVFAKISPGEISYKR